ncbi:MAG: hypothetical protein ACP5NK_00695 [Thermoplasmata archaeon]
MVEIIGSIDNAWKRGKTTNVHHLIFTSDSILSFDVLSKKTNKNGDEPIPAI